jgi:hypothetical protein
MIAVNLRTLAAHGATLGLMVACVGFFYMFEWWPLQTLAAVGIAGAVWLYYMLYDCMRNFFS